MGRPPRAPLAGAARSPAPLLERTEAMASSLPALLVAARRIAATVAVGTHGRRRAGPGEAFWQFRRYQAGDSPAQVDWRRSARGDPLFVREFEWEAAQSVWIGVDGSGSMAYSSHRDLPPKAQRARELALALAVLLIRGGERVALAGHDSRPAQGRAALLRMATTLERSGTTTLERSGTTTLERSGTTTLERSGATTLERSGATTLERSGATTLERSVPDSAPDPWTAPISRHGRMVLFSDLLEPVEDLRKALRRMTANGIGGQLVQVLDPAEETLPFDGRVRFAGLEGEADVLIDRAEDVRKQYQRRLTAHRDAVAALARRAGWGFTLHHTDQPPQTALLSLYQTLSESQPLREATAW